MKVSGLNSFSNISFSFLRFYEDQENLSVLVYPLKYNLCVFAPLRFNKFLISNSLQSIG